MEDRLNLKIEIRSLYSLNSFGGARIAFSVAE
jgi:hypothetical protein